MSVGRNTQRAFTLLMSLFAPLFVSIAITSLSSVLTWDVVFESSVIFPATHTNLDLL